MIIAVDFDGTIVEHKYPAIGDQIPFAIETLKKLQQQHHTLILWSVREGKLLEEAVQYCRERGLEFYAANKDYPEETLEDKNYSRKLKADLFIDDRNLGGIPDWGVIYQMICSGKPFQLPTNQGPMQSERPMKRNIFIRIGEALEGKKG